MDFLTLNPQFSWFCESFLLRRGVVSFEGEDFIVITIFLIFCVLSVWRNSFLRAKMYFMLGFFTY